MFYYKPKLMIMKKAAFLLFTSMMISIILCGKTGTYSGGGDGSSEAEAIHIATVADLIELSTTSADWGLYFKQTADIDFGADETQVDWDDDGTTWGADEADDSKGFSPIGNFTTKFTGTYDGQGYFIKYLFINRLAEGYIGFFGFVDNATLINIGLKEIDISGLYNVGGLAGTATASYGTLLTIEKCYTQGNVLGRNGYYTAGFIGHIQEYNVTKCYSLTSVELSNYLDYSGGFFGRISTFGGGIVSNCYNIGSIILTEYSQNGSYGAFAADAEGSTITNCYSAVSFTNLGNDNRYHGFVYSIGGTQTGCFFDKDLSLQTESWGATATTTEEMKIQTTFTSAGWDFTSTWAIDASRNDGYPYLDWQSFPPTDITWDGSASTDWNTADNWDLGTVPTFDHNVIIPSGLTNNPIIANGTGASCNDLAINSGSSLTVNPGGSLITNGTITNNGTVNIKQSLTEDGHWHFISMPDNATTANTFLHMYLQEWIEGDGDDKGWQDIVDPETALNPVQGYSLWVPAGAKMDFTYTGTPNTGDQSIAVTATGTGENKWMNFVGNPYPSYLDWNEISGYGTKYTWNGTAYQTRTEAGTGDGSQHVAPMEGFFIYKDVGVSDNFSLHNAMRTHLPSTKKDGDAMLQNGLVLAASNGDYEDELWCVFDDETSESFELKYDAWKLKSSTEGLSQLWSVSPDGKMAVDVRPETETIQMGFTNDEAGFYSIGIKEIADITEVYLEDTKTGKFHNLMNDKYEFSWNPELDNENRFILHFKAVGIDENQISESNILIYAANQQVVIKGAEQGDVIISDIFGRVVLQQEISGGGTTNIPLNVETGIYLVTVQNGKEIKTEKVYIR
jgi:hypothetical protein